jgi:epsilon-lactone hydrolase
MNPSEIALVRAELAANPRATEIAQMRIDSDKRGLANPIASDIAIEPTVAGGVPAEWTTAPDANRQRAILYFHGGGYVIGSIDSHRHAVAEIGRAAGARTLALHFRLAPEHPFPAQIEDAVTAYRYLLDSGFEPGNIAFAGDSAGGGLVVASMVSARDQGLKPPACGWCISPWADMESSGASHVEKADEDPMVKPGVSEFMARTYLGGADPRHPLASPIHADLSGLPPLLIQVGAAETLLDDSVRLARVAGAAHVPVQLEIWPSMVHIWHVFPRLTAARRAIATGGAFIRSVMDGRPPIMPRQE